MMSRMGKRREVSEKVTLSSRQKLMIAVPAALVFALLVGAGLVYDEHRASNAPSATAVADSTPFPAPRPQPDSYYDNPWVYFVGDSFTAGTDYDSGRASIWTNIVSEQRGWYPRNIGVPGAGYAKSGEDGRKYADQAQNSQLRDAAAIVVSGGVNDYNSTAEIPTIERGIENTMTKIREFAPEGVPVTVLSVFNPYPGPMPEKMLEMNSLIEREALRIGATYLDVSDLLRGNREQVATDGLHPTDAGHAAIAAAVGPRLPDVLAAKPQR